MKKLIAIISVFVILFNPLFAAQSLAQSKQPTVQEKLQLIKFAAEQTAIMRAALDDANLELIDGKEYYEMGRIGSLISGIILLGGFYFGTINWMEPVDREILRKENTPLTQEQIAQKTAERLAQANKSNNRFYKIYKFTEAEITNHVKSFENDLKAKTYLSHAEIDQIVSNHKLKVGAYFGAFGAGLFSWGLFEIVKDAQAGRILILEDKKIRLENELDAHLEKLNDLEAFYNFLDELGEK